MRIENTPNLSLHLQFRANFTELEKALMKDAMEYSNKNNVETWRLIKHGKDITDQFVLIEKPKESGGYLKKAEKIFGIDTKKLGKFGKYIKYLRHRMKFRNITHIHTHPYEMPFGLNDIRNGLQFRHKKDIVVTPSGKYAVIEYERNKRKIGLEKLNLWDEWYEKYKHLYEGVPREERYKITQRILPEFLDKYFAETGIKYESNIERLPIS